ncbi:MULTISPECIES: hypothetical protein [unclassified Streptomyces]|uniref:hypothetical protein n=1 Tax=unclassified Streptomyces TaxID=2593676 RepID=UPI002E8071D3|nr:hypothetical protein [Streptomyces sp. NBC_00589]WTI33831.1 hypothetical protein OIC96_01930 [Streptomyces sp. NBC_00775]WUB32496.1 hypothetical protein OHA51_47800 [Streptomyces sp. NBC_00589]
MDVQVQDPGVLLLLLYGDGFGELPRTARKFSQGHVDTYIICRPDAPALASTAPVYRDARGEFARLYDVADQPTAFLIRPDGYIGARLSPPTASHLATHLALSFAAAAEVQDAPSIAGASHPGR